MSNESYVISMAKKYRLNISFFEGFVESPGGYTAWFGPGEEYANVERAVENVISNITGD